MENNGSAVSFSRDGRIRFYDEIDLGTMKKSSDWSTYLNLNARESSIIGLNRKEEVDFCCPKVSTKKLWW